MATMQQTAAPNTKRRLTQAEVDQVCAKHDRLFSSKPGGARAVFAWMDLSNLNLSGKNLCDADLSGAVLQGCKLRGARLDNATLFCADLTGAVGDKKTSFAGSNVKRALVAGVYHG